MTLEPCRPPLWAPDGHSQTILGHILPSSRLRQTGRPLVVPLPDGDRLAGRIFEGVGPGRRSPRTVLCLFHGLGGHADADYMHRTARLGLRRGWTVILANHRGCGEGAGLARRPYHSGRAEDLAEVLRLSKTLHPGSRHIAVGFSMSGNALLLLLGGLRGDVLPDAAVIVNAPVDLEKTSHALHRGLNRAYELRFVVSCRGQIPDLSTRRRLTLRHTLRDFDEIYTAPASGFSDRAEYYRTCSSKLALARLARLPTAILTSVDDPFVDHADYLAQPLPPHVHLHLEPHGGHMGYLTRELTPLGTRRWLDYALDRILEQLAAE